MKRVLVVCYSQTGQLRRCAETFVEPFRKAGVEVDFISPKPKVAYPFPWGFDRFIDVFPESVRGTVPEMDDATMRAPKEKYDLVILAYQVWYLAVALPVVAWLRSSAADVLKDTPVVALCACRNMWQRAFVDLKSMVSAKAGRVVDHVVREDSGPAWATFWSTPRWMFTGDRVGMGILPVAGVSDADIATLQGPGEKLAVALQTGPLTTSVLGGSEARVHKIFVIPELVARFFFARWASLITNNPGQRRWLARAFFVSLCCSIPVMIPAALPSLFIRLFARRWFRGKVEEAAA